MTVINPFDFFVEAYAEKYPFAYEPILARELVPYLETAAGRAEACRRSSRAAPADGSSTIDYLVDINQRRAAGRRLRDPDGAGHPDAARRR